MLNLYATGAALIEPKNSPVTAVGQTQSLGFVSSQSSNRVACEQAKN